MSNSPRQKKSAATTNHQTYFEKLQFDPSLLTSWVARYLGSIRVVLLLILTISLLGTVSYLSLPQRLNPEVKIPIVAVSTVLPGASPEDIESLVTIPLENELKGIKGLDSLNSTSRDNVSIITLQFLSSVTPDDAKDEVQAKVDGVTDLPDDAKVPQVKVFDFEDQPVWTFTITTQGDLRSLMSFSDELKNKLEDLSKVDRVITSGFEEQEVLVTLQPAKVTELGLNPLLLSQAIQKSVSSYPAGTVETGRNVFPITINPAITTIPQIRELKIAVQGKTVQLGDIATVEERSKSNQQRAYFATADQAPQRAVTFYVYKSTTAEIDDAGAEIKTLVDAELTKYKHQFKLTTLVNTSDEIKNQFADLLGEFRSTIILVFICLLLFLGLRQAVISSFTVPLTFLSAFVCMQIIGMSINFLSLFAFLLALGLLVDDTIVVVSAMTSYYKVGKFTPLQTGLLVWRDTIVPIWSTTITTIWSFVPLLLASGIIGEFIKPIPVVVTVTMLSSTAIAVLITLPMMIVLLKPDLPARVWVLIKLVGVLVSLGLLVAFLKTNPLLPVIAGVYLAGLVMISLIWKPLMTSVSRWWHRWPAIATAGAKIKKYSDRGLIDVEGVSAAYYRLIYRVLSSVTARRQVIFAIVIYAMVGFGLLMAGQVNYVFFPGTDEKNIFVQAELPAGLTADEVDVETQLLAERLRSTHESEYVIAEAGRGINQQNGAVGESGGSVLVSIHLPDPEERNITSFDLAEQLRQELQDYTKGKISVISASGGPPVGSDLEVKIVGEDLTQLDVYANQIMAYLQRQGGVTNVDKSIKPGVSQLVFVPDYTKLNEAGLSVDTVGIWLRLYASGFTLDSVNFNKSQSDKQDIVFKFDVNQSDAEGLSSLSIPTQTGTSYPLLSLGHFEIKPNPTLITREDGQRTISVAATVKDKATVTARNQELLKFVDELNMPDGYGKKTGGANEENQKSVNSILQAMLLSVVLILITMVVQFGSFRQAFIVLIVIPLAVSSVFVVFGLLGIPLSFPALIGVLSLFGIVVTNSMFIVDKINLNKQEGMRLKEAIADAGASRLEPIILTKLCTVFGLLPITIADPLWRGLGGAIISGLLISSTIMLLFIPALYYEFFKNDQE